jgi:hypothetical protein
MAIEITARSLADTQQAEMASGEAIQPSELSGLPEKSMLVSRFLRRSLRWTRRNFSSRAKLLSGGEVLILSAPKSGHFFAPTYASGMVLSSPCSPGGTIILGFRG